MTVLYYSRCEKESKCSDSILRNLDCNIGIVQIKKFTIQWLQLRGGDRDDFLFYRNRKQPVCGKRAG